MHAARIGPLMFALALMDVATTAAQDCPLRGTVVNTDGSPAAGAMVTVIRSGMFRRTTRQETAGADGTFSIPDLPCGTYMVSTIGFTTTVDTNKRHEVTLTMPDAFRSGMSALRDLEMARAARAKRAPTPEEARDEQTAAALRERVVQKLASPKDFEAYQRSQSDDDRVQRFVLTVAAAALWRDDAAGTAATRAGGGSRFNPFRSRTPILPNQEDTAREQARRADQRIREDLVASRTFVERYLPAEAAGFDDLSRRRQALALLRACRARLAEQPWPTAGVLFTTDTNYGVTAKGYVRSALGQESVEWSEWDSRLSPRWRGEALRRAMLTLFANGMAVAEGRMAMETFVAQMSDARPETYGSSDMSMFTVADVLGTAGLEAFLRGSATARRDLAVDATLLQFGLQWATLLEL
jgi:hypothetical protein